MYKVETDKEYIQGEQILNVLKKAGMGTQTSELHQKAFENSYKIILIFNAQNNELIGCGRLISDGCYQAAAYDIAIDPDYQGLGLGRVILENLLQDMEKINVILYASPGKETFYEKFGFRLGKTSMVKFVNRARMKDTGYTE